MYQSSRFMDSSGYLAMLMKHKRTLPSSTIYERNIVHQAMMAAIHVKMSYIRKVTSSVDFYNTLAAWDR